MKLTHQVKSDLTQTHAPQPNVLNPNRFYYMDNLRAFAMLAGILFHAALAYSPLVHNFWVSADADKSTMLDMFSWFSHLFRMPLFFFLSGFLALMLLEKRGVKAYLKNRSLRILLPLIVFLPILAWVTFESIFWAIENVKNQPPILKTIAAAMAESTGKSPTIKTFHLWFLFNLYLFCLLVAALFKTGFFNNNKFLTKLSTKHIVFIIPLLLIPSLMTQSAPHPPADKIYPELWSFGYYGLIFLGGCVLFTRKGLLDQLESYRTYMLVASLVGFSLYYYLIPKELSLAEIIAFKKHGPTIDMKHFLLAFLSAFISVYMTLVCVLASRQFLNYQSQFLRFIADSSYWVYLVHLPVLYMVQFMLVDLDLNLWLKFIIGSVVTVAVGMISYLFFVRKTPIGWMLNGKKQQTTASK